MNYANRIDEFSKLSNFLRNWAQIIFLEAKEACGISSFLKEFIRRNSNYYLGFYIDSNSSKSLSELILDKLVKSVYLPDIQRITDQNLGDSKCVDLIKKLLDTYAYGLGSLMEGKALPIYSGNYNSILEELLLQYLDFISKTKNVLIVIDSAQKMQENSYETLINLTNVIGIKIVVATTSNNIKSKKIYNYINNFKGLEIESISFTAPYAKMIIEIARLEKITLTEQEAIQIEKSTRKNIHEIINHLRKQKGIQVDLDAVDLSVMIILCICNFGILKDDLLSILKSVYPLNSNNCFDGSIKKLIKNNIVCKKLDNRYELIIYNHPKVKEYMDNEANILFYSSNIYNQIAKKEFVSKEESELLYYLGKNILNYPYANYAKKILSFKLNSGENISSELINDVSFSKQNNNDCKLASIVFCKNKNYSASFEWLKSIKKPSQDFINLKSIILNRLRLHAEAEEALLINIEKESCNSKKNILLAYLVSNYIHCNDISSAISLWDKYNGSLFGTENFGYFSRNMASIKLDDTDFYKIAFDNFTENKDLFGFYTSKSNYANTICETDAEESLKIMYDCEFELKKYGIHNLNIIYNNLGIANILTNNFEEAVKYFNSSMILSKSGMPEFFAKINLSVALAINNKAGSLDIIRSLESEVLNHSVDRVRQKYYPNRILVECINEEYNIDDLLIKMEKHLDRYNPNFTKERINLYKKISIDRDISMYDLKKLYIPCFLAYWYIDPLKLISHGAFN